MSAASTASCASSWALPCSQASFLNAEASMRWLYLIGIVPLATGLMSTCPLYSILGLSTCPMKKG
jgi:hypothetical protein